MRPDRCRWKRCRRDGAMTYLGRPICSVHWAQFCQPEEAGRLDAALERIGMTSEQRDRANRRAMPAGPATFIIACVAGTLMVLAGFAQPRRARPAESPAPREPFALTFLDYCWTPLPPDAWRMRSRSFGTWNLCMTGPGEPAGPYARAYFDTDTDGDVDLRDWSRMQLHWER